MSLCQTPSLGCQAALAGAGNRFPEHHSMTCALWPKLSIDETAWRPCAQDIFGKAGAISRVVLPVTCTIALVEFKDRQAAQHAFRTLAYAPLQHVPMFLEWAPQGIFLQQADGQHTLPTQQVTPLSHVHLLAAPCLSGPLHTLCRPHAGQHAGVRCACV